MDLTSNDPFMIMEDPPVKRSTPVYLLYQYARSIYPTISFALLIKLYTIYQEDPDLYESEPKPWKTALEKHPELKKPTQHIKNIGHIFQQMHRHSPHREYWSQNTPCRDVPEYDAPPQN